MKPMARHRTHSIEYKCRVVEESHHRYMQIEAFSQIDAAQTDPILRIQTQAA